MARVTIPKTYTKLSPDQKKKFVELNSAGAYNDSYASYLGLNQAEIQFYKGQIAELTKEVSEAEDKKAKRIAALQRDAQKANEAFQAGQGVKAKNKKENVDWTVPADQEKIFKIEAGVRHISFLVEKYGVGAESICREIERLEKKK